MRRARVLGLAVAAACIAPAAAAHGQSLASRIDAVREGRVLLSYASRPGLCGDGDNVIRYGREVWVLPDMFGWNRDRGGPCFTGPVRVSIGRAGGETVSLRIRIGGTWNAGEGDTNLGTVSASEASRYFLEQARAIGGKNGDYAVAAAAIADSAALASSLTAFARDERIRMKTRSYALMWLGIVDDADAHAALRRLITDATLPSELRGNAIIGLGHGSIERDDATFLQAQYASLPSSLHDKVFLAIARSDDPRVQRWLIGKVLDDSETLEVRKQALFWAGQGDVPLKEIVAVYDRLRTRDLREHFTFVLSQRREDGAVDKLIDIALHDADRDVRKQAIFWLGQSKDSKATAFLRDLITR